MIDWQKVSDEMNVAPWTHISPRVKEKRVFLTNLKWVPWMDKDVDDEEGQRVYETIEDQAASRGWYLDFSEDSCFEVYVCNLQLIFPMLQDDDKDFERMSEVEQ